MKLKNRIAAEDLKDVQAWSLPSVGGKGKVLTAEAKPNRDPSLGRGTDSQSAPKAAQPSASKPAPTSASKPAQQANAAPEPVQEVVAEVIEDVDVDSLEFAPMTADELQAITDAAEQEGITQGRKRGLELGLEEGRQQGLEQGLQQAKSEAAAQLQQQVAQLLQIAEQLVEPIAVQQQGLEHLLVETITALTKQLVTRELQTDSSNILSVVKQAMAALPVGGQQVTLRLNPDDLALIEAHSEEQHLPWRFVGDASLIPGGCKISTADSLVDFSVETRLESLLQQFVSGQLFDERVEIPAPKVEPSAPIVEEHAPAVEPSAPIVEEDAPAVEPSASIVEEDAPAVEASAPVVEEDASEFDAQTADNNAAETTSVAGPDAVDSSTDTVDNRITSSAPGAGSTQPAPTDSTDADPAALEASKAAAAAEQEPPHE